jgi:hypothetical protein
VHQHAKSQFVFPGSISEKRGYMQKCKNRRPYLRFLQQEKRRKMKKEERGK